MLNDGDFNRFDGDRFSICTINILITLNFPFRSLIDAILLHAPFQISLFHPVLKFIPKDSNSTANFYYCELSFIRPLVDHASADLCQIGLFSSFFILFSLKYKRKFIPSYNETLRACFTVVKSNLFEIFAFFLKLSKESSCLYIVSTFKK